MIKNYGYFVNFNLLEVVMSEMYIDVVLVNNIVIELSFGGKRYGKEFVNMVNSLFSFLIKKINVIFCNLICFYSCFL